MVYRGLYSYRQRVRVITFPKHVFSLFPNMFFPNVMYIEQFCNLVPRAHVSVGQRRDTELWNNPFLESKILGLPVQQRMRGLAKKRRPEVKSMWIRSTKAFNTHSHRLYL